MSANDPREDDIGRDCVSEANGQDPWQPLVRGIEDHEDEPDREKAQPKDHEALQKVVQQSHDQRCSTI